MKMQYVIYLLMIALFVSCDSETLDGGDAPPSQSVINLAVSVTLPQPEEVDALTRASYTDTNILNLDLLVFDANAKFMERIKVESSQLEVTPAGIDFTVRVNAAPHDRIIHIVVNGRSADGLTDRLNLDDITEGMDESVAIPSLKTAPMGGGVLADHIMPLVMWGRFVLVNGITDIDGVKLLRAAACIQVKKGTGSSSNGLNNLTILGITVHRGVGEGFLAPADYAGAVSTPSVARPVVTSGTNYVDYSKGWVNSSMPSLYIYERNCSFAPNDYMGVLIRARYKGVEGYYKIVMADANGTPLNIIRNHRYIITIVAVNGYGYADVATAISSAPTNALRVDVVDEDPGFTCIVADGQHWMSLSNNTFNLYATADSPAGVVVCTGYSSRGIVPVLEYYQGDIEFTVEALEGNKFQVVGHALVSGAYDSATLTVRCDNLSLPVCYNWYPSMPGSADGDSYVFELVSSNDKNWNARLTDNSSSANWLGLHYSAGTPGVYPGISTMTELSSKFHSHAYLHVGAGSNRMGTVMKSSVVDGEVVVNKIVIAQ